MSDLVTPAPTPRRTDRKWIAAALVLLAAGVLRQMELPGLYMDAVNPEYYAARALHADPLNFAYEIPSVTIPLLTGLYVGVQNFLVGLPLFALFGTSVTTLRLFHGLIGAALVIAVFVAVRRATRESWGAGVAALALAADPALVASLRTQFEIVLGGTVWVVAALAVLLGKPADGAATPPRKGIFLAGALFGLSIYGYFVNGFFGPAILWLVLRGGPGRGGRLRALALGMAVGLLPYVFAYASWAMAAGSLDAFAADVRGQVRGLVPFMPAGPIERLEYGWMILHVALTNVGNELMIFGTADPIAIAGTRLAIMGLVIVAGAVGWTRTGEQERGLLAVLLAASYLTGALVFGKRLWAHHLIPLLPIAWIAFGIGLVGALRWFGPSSSEGLRRGGKTLAATSCVIVVSLSLVQQHRFFGRLAATGGAGMCSDASTLLAQTAIRERADHTIYVFPEWGFLIPFAFLTGNGVPYETQVEAPRVHEALGSGRKVVLAYWKSEDAARYRDALVKAGAAATLHGVPMLQRDGKPAFHLLVANGK